jgi:predicted nucleic acid-binding protein
MTENYLIDTNVLVYAYNSSFEKHSLSKSILETAMNGDIKAYITDKNIYEFYAIVTDSKRVEKPVSPEKPILAIRTLLDSELNVLNTSKRTIAILLDLCKKYKVKRQNIFDFIFVAVMLEFGIDGIITYILKDFSFIEEIEVIDPRQIVIKKK